MAARPAPGPRRSARPAPAPGRSATRPAPRTWARRSVSARSRRANRSARSSTSASGSAGGASSVNRWRASAASRHDQALLGQVVDGRRDAAAVDAERGGRVVGDDRGPDAAGAAGLDDVAQEVAPLAGEPRVDVVERRLRPDPVAGVERRALADHALQFQVRERRAQHQRARVEPAGEVVLGHGERLADGVAQQPVDQAGERRAGRRVAVGEVLEAGHVVGAGQQLADRGQPVAAGAADLLRVVTRATSAGSRGTRSARRRVSMPMPNAIVATTMPRSAVAHHSCTAVAVGRSPCPRGTRGAGSPAPASARATSTACRWKVT